MNAQGRRLTLPSLSRPDLFYAVVAGLYVAVVAVPVLLVGLDRWVRTDPGALYIGSLVAITVLSAVGGWGASRVRGLPERVGARSRLWWLLIGLPVLPVGIGFIGVTSGNSLSTAVAALGFGLGLLGILLGFGLVTLSRSRYAAAVVDEDSVGCAWTAGRPAFQRRRRRYLGAIAVPVCAGAFVGGFLWQNTLLRYGGQLLLPLSILLLDIVPHDAVQHRTMRVTPVGLERTGGSARILHHWDAIEQYEMTDDALVIHWQSWWRPAERFARADIEDVNAVEDALADYLPRA